jgi:hypothetical protein
MATQSRRPSAAPPVTELRPPADGRVGLARRLRKGVGAALEYAWELSGSLRHYRADAVLVTGEERETGLPFTSFYFGHYDNFAFIFGRAYRDYEVVLERRGVSSLYAKRWAARFRDRVALLCIDVELLFSRTLGAELYLVIPPWVRQKYDVPDSWDGVLASFRKNTRKTDLRKVRKYGLTYRITQSERDYREFYHWMYVPYLRKRFGDEVIIEPEWKVLRQCRKGALMHIVRDDRVVAAVLLHRLGGRLAYVWVGVPDGLDAELRHGAFSALYYYTIMYGYRHGCDEIDFLGSRPLLNDGLFRYKRKWGTYVEDSPVPRGDILLAPVRFSEPVKSFFRRNHFIVRDGSALVGKILVHGAAQSEDELARTYTRLYTRGLRGLKLYSLGGFPPEAYTWAEREGAALRLIDLSGSPDPADAFSRL